MKNYEVPGIYSIKIGKYEYIGQSENMYSRLKNHFSLIAPIHTNLMYLEIEEKKWENISIRTEIIEADEIRRKQELIKIQECNTLFPDGYNLYDGKNDSAYKRWIKINRKYKILEIVESKGRDIFFENTRIFKSDSIYLPESFNEYIKLNNHRGYNFSVDRFFDYFKPASILEIKSFKKIKDEGIKKEDLKVVPFLKFIDEIDSVEGKPNFQKTIFGQQTTFNERVLLNFGHGLKSFKTRKFGTSVQEYLISLLDKIEMTKDKIIRNLYYDIHFINFKKKYYSSQLLPLEKFDLNIGYFRYKEKSKELDLIVIRYDYISLLAKNMFTSKQYDHKGKSVVKEIYIIDENSIVIQLFENKIINEGNLISVLNKEIKSKIETVDIESIDKKGKFLLELAWHIPYKC